MASKNRPSSQPDANAQAPHTPLDGRRGKVTRPSGLSSGSQRFAIVKRDGKKRATPAFRWVISNLYLNGDLHCRTLADLHWLRTGQTLGVEKLNEFGQGGLTLINAIVVDDGSTINHGGLYGQLERSVYLKEQPRGQGKFKGLPLTQVFPHPLPITQDVCTLFFKEGSEAPLTTVLLDLHHLEEGSQITFVSQQPGELGKTEVCTVQQNTPIITIHKGEFRRTFPFYKFGQVKRVITLIPDPSPLREKGAKWKPQ